MPKKKPVVADIVANIASIQERKEMLSQAIRGLPMVTQTRVERKDGSIRVKETEHLLDPLEACDLLNKMDKLYSPTSEPNQLPVITNFVFVLPDGSQLTPRQLVDGSRNRNKENPAT